METLLLCADPEALTLVRHVLGELGSNAEVFEQSGKAMARLRDWRFDTVIVDCDATPNGREVLGEVRHTSRNRKAVVFAMIGEGNGERSAYAMGANFVLEKPLDPERVARLLRAAYAIIVVRERFRYFRHHLKVIVTLSCGEKKYQASTINISGSGLMLQLDKPLLTSQPVHLIFNLPDSDIPIIAQGDVVWEDAAGRVGVRFRSLPHLSRKRLHQWLSEQVPPGEIWSLPPVEGGGGPAHRKKMRA